MYEMEIEECSRSIANVVRIGVVCDVNYETFSCTVRDEKGLLVDNVIWASAKAGTNSVWFPPEGGESVIYVSPNGILGTSFIIGTFHTQVNLPPSFDENEHIIKYRDDGTEGYNSLTSSKYITTGGEEGSLSITTGDGQTTIIANKDEIDLDIQDVKITINPSSITLTSGENVVTMDNTNNTTTLTNGQNTITSDQTSISIETPTNTILMNQSMVSITSNTSIDLNAPMVNITASTISANGNITSTGNSTFNGQTTVNGNFSSTNIIQAPVIVQNGIILGTHTHSGVLSGPDLSGPPNP